MNPFIDVCIKSSHTGWQCVGLSNITKAFNLCISFTELRYLWYSGKNDLVRIRMHDSLLYSILLLGHERYRYSLFKQYSNGGKDIEIQNLLYK